MIGKQYTIKPGKTPNVYYRGHQTLPIFDLGGGGGGGGHTCQTKVV